MGEGFPLLLIGCCAHVQFGTLAWQFISMDELCFPLLLIRWCAHVQVGKLAFVNLVGRSRSNVHHQMMMVVFWA